MISHTGNKIGILDFGLRKDPFSKEDKIYNLIKEARFIENLGFSRLWYAEHLDDSNDLIWSSPDVILSLVAAYTDHIRIGIAGTSVRYHLPVKVAADYQLLSAAFPGRIDLGISKGMSLTYENALGGREGNHKFADQRAGILERMSSLCSIINGSSNFSKPEIWALSNSFAGEQEALGLSINNCRSLMHLRSDLPAGATMAWDMINKNIKDFKSRERKYTVCVAGTIQDSKKLISEIRSAHEGAIDVSKAICGNAEFVHAAILGLFAQLEIDEIIFYEMSYRIKERRKSLKALSKIAERL